MTDIQHLIDAPGDAELISRVRGGDLEAYGELYTRHVDAARRLARQLVRGPDSDDLVSEAFAKVMGVLRRGGGPDVAFRAYLLTSVRRLHVDRIRSQSRLTTTDDLEPFDPGVPFHDTAVAQFESGAAAKAFASLPERWQLVLWHLEVEGQKPAEIATLLGMSPNSVSALAYRAREGLRQAFLAAHLAETDKAECRWVTEHLGGYVRKGLSKRDNDKVALHLDVCHRCTAMYLELTEVNDNLAGIIAPLLLGGLGAGYLSAGGGSAAGGVVGLVGRAKDVVVGNVGPVVAGTAAAAVAVATVVVIAVLGDDPPVAGRSGAEGPWGGLDTPSEPAGPPGGLPRPRTSDEALSVREPARVAPVLIAGLDESLAGLVGVTAPEATAITGPATVLEPEQGAGTTPGDLGGPDDGPGDGPGDGPAEGPGPDPGEPDTDIRISSATVSDDALVVDVDNLPLEPVTVVVDLASDSGRAAFVPGQRTCSVDAATPTRAVCVTSTAMARTAAAQLTTRSFQAVIPLDFPADVDVDFLDVSVNVLGYRETNDVDNRIRFEYRPNRTPTDGPTSGLPTDGPTSELPTDGPTTELPTDGATSELPTDGPPSSGPDPDPDPDPLGPDLRVTLSRHSESDGGFKVQVTTPRGNAPAGVPLRVDIDPASVGFSIRDRGCDGPSGGVMTCGWNGNTWVGFFEAPLAAGDELEVAVTASLPGYRDPQPADNTDTLRLSSPAGPKSAGPGTGKSPGPGKPAAAAPQPSGQAQPSKPAQPGKPSGPAKPSQPAGQDKPSKPSGPVKPSKPAQDPSTPSQSPGQDKPAPGEQQPGKPGGKPTDRSADESPRPGPAKEPKDKSGDPGRDPRGRA